MNEKIIKSDNSKKEIQVNKNRNFDQETLNDLYSKFENIINKKKLNTNISKPLNKFTNINSIQEKNLSGPVPFTASNNFQKKEKFIEITKTRSSANLKIVAKEDQVFSKMMTRMNSYELLKQKKNNEETLKKHYELIKSCNGTPKINPKSRILCGDEDFFKRMIKVEKKKENNNKTLRLKTEERLLSEVKIETKKIGKSKIDERINSLIKWEKDRKDKNDKKQMELVNESFVECTFRPEFYKSSKKFASKFINNYERNEKSTRDKSIDKQNNISDSSHCQKKENINSGLNIQQSTESLNKSVRKMALNKQIKTSRKDEQIIEKLLKEKFQSIDQNYD